MKELKQRYLNLPKNEDLNEADLLRQVANWMDHRPEYMNQGKTINQLLKRFLEEQLSIKELTSF